MMTSDMLPPVFGGCSRRSPNSDCQSDPATTPKTSCTPRPAADEAHSGPARTHRRKSCSARRCTSRRGMSPRHCRAFALSACSMGGGGTPTPASRDDRGHGGDRRGRWRWTRPPTSSARAAPATPKRFRTATARSRACRRTRSRSRHPTTRCSRRSTAAVSGQLNPDVDLVDTLNGDEFTVFAPVDEAFAKIDPATIEALKTDSRRR